MLALIKLRFSLVKKMYEFDACLGALGSFTFFTFLATVGLLFALVCSVTSEMTDMSSIATIVMAFMLFAANDALTLAAASTRLCIMSFIASSLSLLKRSIFSISSSLFLSLIMASYAFFSLSYRTLSSAAMSSYFLVPLFPFFPFSRRFHISPRVLITSLGDASGFSLVTDSRMSATKYMYDKSERLGASGSFLAFFFFFPFCVSASTLSSAAWAVR
mmetsp:Transcript_1170/g.1703  ORF Transcript_1170/g.1703 Transcript_1170/m.1703 type:complete len:217 (-) Transcript_1170:227-877(-)